MANWCTGNVRFRGTEENIKKFLDNEIVYVTGGFDDLKEEKPKKTENEYLYVLTLPYDRFSFYIKNTRRNFFFKNQIEIYWPDCEPNEEIVVCIDDFNAAWDFSETGWLGHAENYGIDIRMFGYERGMEFSQIMTITRDGKVNNNKIKYANYQWDCPFPNLGG